MCIHLVHYKRVELNKRLLISIKFHEISITSCLVEQMYASQEYFSTTNLANAVRW